MSRLRGFVRGNSLSLVFLAIFLAALAGQAVAGWHLYNQDQHEHGEPGISLTRFLTSSRFAAETTENWQSEFLQFTLYIAATIWLIRRGSSPGGAPSRGGAAAPRAGRAGAAR